jgi:hypothetical protein
VSVLGPIVRLLVEVAAERLDWITVPSEPGTRAVVWTDDYELRKLTASWSRTPSRGVVQDRDQCTFHFLNLTGGNPDASWIDADFTAVENAFDTFWGAIKDQYATQTVLVEYMWRADGPAFKPHGSSLSPTLRVVSRSLPGTGGGDTQQLPPQCAITVTEVTASHYTAFGVGVPGHAPGTGRTQVRNRWGRFYLPAPNAGALNVGRVLPATCTQISDAVKTFYNACVTAQLVPVMYSPTTGSSWSIDAVHVDDIFDVIRSRRFIVPTTRAPNTINPSS